MTGGRLRAAVRAAVEGLAARRARPLPAGDLQAPLLVLAPHQDDETLGCGGLIARQRARGLPVTVVFVTDGRTSHAKHLDPDELARRRRDEAVAACAELGVPADAVRFLAFRDGELAAAVPAAAARVAELLRERPDHVLLAPYAGDTTPDHRATLAVALAALASLPAGATRTLLEYPVWFWHHWPWVCPPAGGRRQRAALALAGLGAAARRLRELRHAVDVTAELPTKRRALACHATQTTRPPDQPRWPVLADVAGGQWLEIFFSGREHFRRRRLPTGR